jgi:hypothetical protein
MLPCFSALRRGRCRRRVRVAVLPSAPLNGVTSKLFPSLVEIATGLAGSTLSNSSTGLSRISANEFPCRTSILIISGDSLYIHCITAQALIFLNIRSRGVEGALRRLYSRLSRRRDFPVSFFAVGRCVFLRLHRTNHKSLDKDRKNNNK